MLPGYETQQANNITPPRVGQIIALNVDATSRGYDLTALLWNGVPANKSGLEDYFYLSMQCETNDVFYAFDGQAVGADAIDDTQATAAGGTPALDTPGALVHAQCARLISGLPEVPVRINRGIDKTLILKCASGKTAIIRIWASSQSTPGVT